MTDFKTEWENAKTDLEKRAVIERVLNTYCTNESAVYFDDLVNRLEWSEHRPQYDLNSGMGWSEHRPQYDLNSGMG